MTNNPYIADDIAFGFAIGFAIAALLFLFGVFLVYPKEPYIIKYEVERKVDLTESGIILIDKKMKLMQKAADVGLNLKLSTPKGAYVFHAPILFLIIMMFIGFSFRDNK